MINVSAQTKNAYKGSSHKVLTITLGSFSFSNDQIAPESLSIDEILESEDYLHFTGCNTSKATFTLFGISANFKGQSVTITIKADNTDTITLFHGYVESQTVKDYTSGTVDFTCFDTLYTVGQTDVAEWYKSLTFPITIGNLRAQLFTYLNLTAVSTTLVNDSVEIDRQYIPENLAAIDVIKALCQLDAVFGIINRNGEFEFRTLQTIGTSDDTVDYYKTIDYERYSVKSIGKVIVRQSDSVAGASFGSGDNVYIVQGNMFTYNLSDVVLHGIAQNIHARVHGKVYVPYSADTYGMPWVEVGDVLTYRVFDPETGTHTPMQFYVLHRKLSGIQDILDTTSAEGQEYQTVFLSNLSVQIDTIKADVESIKQSLDKAVIKHYQSVNETALTIGNDWVKVCDFLPFNHYATDVTDFVFEGSLKFTAETTETLNSDDEYVITPCQMLVKYSLNGADLSYIPTDVYDDGTHTVALNYQFAGVTKNTATGVEVFAKALTGSVSVAIGNSIGYLWGQNLAERQLESIYVKTMPTRVQYVVGMPLDLNGCTIYGVYTDGAEEDVTSLCTFDPADGDTLSEVGTQTVTATYGAFEVSFDVSVIEIDLLRYLIYTETNSAYIVSGFKMNNIYNDSLEYLPIPNTYNGKEIILEN